MTDGNNKKDFMEAIRSVTVFLGSSNSSNPAFTNAVVDFAEYLVRHKMTLVFGGSNTGSMKLLADTVLKNGGKAVGIFTRALPERLIRHDLTETVITETLAERKAELIRRADAIVALPGSIGTWDELFDALAQKKLPNGITCPIGVLNVEGYYDPLFELIRNSFEAGFSTKHHCDLLKSGRTAEELFRQFEGEI